MCLLILIILTADIFCSGMADYQYTLFPLMFRILHMICTASCIIFLGWKASRGELLHDRITYLFLGFVILILISTLINGISQDSLTGVPFRYLGAFDFQILAIAYTGCVRQTCSLRAGYAVLDLYLLAADLTAVAFIYDRYIGRIDAFRDKNEPSAIFFHGNHYGYFLVPAVLISAGYLLYCRRQRAYAGMISMLLSLACLVINRSMGCIIAAAAVLLFAVMTILIGQSAGRGRAADRACVIKAALMGIFFLALGLIMLIFNTALRDDLLLLIRESYAVLTGEANGFAGHGRWELWTETASYIAQHPLLGWGCEGIREMLLEATGTASPHNEILTYAAFFGVPAAMIYAAAVISALLYGTSIGRAARGSMLYGFARADRGLIPDDPGSVLSGPAAADHYGPVEDPGAALRRISSMAAAGYFISSLFGVAMFYTAPFLFIFSGLASAPAPAHDSRR